MFIVLTPIKEDKEFDVIGYNSDLILNVRNTDKGHGCVKFINGEEVIVKERRKEIVLRINRSVD